MAWTAPMTAVANTVWFASQFNRFLRDNLKETAPALATAEGQYFVSSQTAKNKLIPRTAVAATVNTSQTTTSTSYTDLATTGPRVTVTTGTTAAVFIACELGNNTLDSASFASFAVTGASNIPAGELASIRSDGKTAANNERGFAFSWEHGLRPGSNTFTMKYKAGSNTATFLNRHIAVMPLS